MAGRTDKEVQAIFNAIYDAEAHALCTSTPNENPNGPTDYEVQYILNDCLDAENNQLRVQ